MLVKVFVDPKETKGDLVHVFITLPLILPYPYSLPSLLKCQPYPMKKVNPPL